MHNLTASTLLKNSLFKDTNIKDLKLGEEFGKFKSINIGTTLYKEGDPSDESAQNLNARCTIPAKGTARTRPARPEISAPIRSAKMMMSGGRPTALDMILGVTIFASICWTRV